MLLDLYISVSFDGGCIGFSDFLFQVIQVLFCFLNIFFFSDSLQFKIIIFKCLHLRASFYIALFPGSILELIPISVCLAACVCFLHLVSFKRFVSHLMAGKKLSYLSRLSCLKLAFVCSYKNSMMCVANLATFLFFLLVQIS